MYNTFIMKNVKILKKVVPLLREKEEIVAIPEKNKKDILSCIFACVFAITVCIILWVMTISTSSFSEMIVPISLSASFLFVFCLIIIYIFNKVIVITNQRLIYFTIGKVVFIERENIETVTYDCMQRGISKNTTVIETKDLKLYKIEYYDYKRIKEIIEQNV